LAGATRSADLETLLGLLDLEEVTPDATSGAGAVTDRLFLGRHRPGEVSIRTFGGQLVSQAMVAAGRTVKAGLPMHAVNAHFIRGGDVKEPIEYRVERHRDGRTYANRTVTACQGGEELFVMLVAFQDWSPGLEHAAAVPDVPGPEGLPRIDEHFVGFEDKLQMFIGGLKPCDLRYTNDPAWILKASGEKLGHNRVWMRADGHLPDDPLLHVAALGYSSDTTVLDSIITTHGLAWGLDRIVAVTVNHSIWFHRPFRYDEWMLYATESPVAAGSRGLATGRFFSRDGELCATVVQEGVIKYFPPRRR
jgi:acyl-CoA thioesterase-2